MRERAEALEAGVLETFLGGMETKMDCGLEYLKKTLKPSLVEWKLRVAPTALVWLIKP